MDNTKSEALRNQGWSVGSAYDFLGSTPEEIELIELRLALSRRVKSLRAAQQLTQSDLAQRLGSSQSRVAKIEAGDPSVSLDLLFRSIFVLGETRQDIFKSMAEMS